MEEKEMRNSWDWNAVVDKGCWLEPSDEGYYYAVKWSREGKNVILDLGCGLGRHSILFDSYGFHVTAVDSSVEAIDFLREHCSKEGLDIECDVADMHDLPYADDTFDCIFAYLSVSHTDSKGILKVMSEIRRVLKTGGSIFFTLCSKDTWSYRDSGYERIDDNTVVKPSGPEKGIPHFYVDRQDIEDLMEGFTLIRVRHIDDCFIHGRWQNSKHYFIEAELM